MASIASPGIGSGLDINSLVSQLLAAEAQAPTTRLDRREAALQVRLSGYGSIKGSLASLKSSLVTLGTLDTYTSRSASSSDTDVVVATTTGEAAAVDYDLNVTTLAASHKLSTDPALSNAQFTSVTDSLGTGKLTFKFGTTSYDKGTDNYSGFVQSTEKSSATVTITDGSLQGVRDAINNADIGVSASIIFDGTHYRLTINSDDTGAANSLQISADDDDLNDDDTSGLSLLSFNSSSTNLEQTEAAQDSALTVNGIGISSSSNTITDALENVTLTLKKTGTATVNVSRDSGRIKTAVNAFVNTYNSYLDSVDDLAGYDPDTKRAGSLNGDAVIRGITASLQRLIGTAVGDTESTFSILADIGITTDSSSGKLVVDSSILEDKIANNSEDIEALFAAYGKVTDTFVGFEGSGEETQEGKYAVNISQLATKGTLAGSAAANLTITADSNDTLVLDIDGVSATITLTAGTYTASSLVAELQSKINNASEISGAGSSVLVTESAGVISITSSRYGSASVVEITGGTGKADLVGASPVKTDGVDVAGTIGGVAATGSGQYLTGAGDAEGLKLLITGVSLGDRGTVNFNRGYSDRLDSYLESLIGSNGSLDSTTSAIQDSIDAVSNDRASLQRRLDSIEKRIRAQFVALDTLVSQLQSTSSFLSQQLASLPTVNTTQK
jgi:flagellar hook-associated protein 2